MSECDICKVIKEKRHKVYEDDLAYAFVAEQPAAAGHVIVVPKEHYPILEQVPPKVAGHLFFIANKIAVSVFESLGAHGTNIIVQNGIPAGQEFAHFMIHIVPRRENDGLNMEWSPLQASDDELGTAELLIKQQTKGVGIFDESKKPVEISDAPKEVISETKDEEGEKKENYLIKQLRRQA